MTDAREIIATANLIRANRIEAGLEEMTRSCLAERAGRLAAEAERDRLREALTKLCDWVEHEVGAELPFDARTALKAAMEAGR